MRINISGGRTLHAMLLTHITQHTFYPNMQHNFNLNQTNNKHKVCRNRKIKDRKSCCCYTFVKRSTIGCIMAKREQNVA